MKSTNSGNDFGKKVGAQALPSVKSSLFVSCVIHKKEWNGMTNSGLTPSTAKNNREYLLLSIK